MCRRASGAAPAEAARHIERTKWTVLAGTALAVGSSSLLYINLILAVVMPDTFWHNPWLHPLVFMLNLDSKNLG